MNEDILKKYKPIIGLEIHAELKTNTKMFCNSKNDPNEIRPNINICPVCMGYPGTLPTVNKEAVKKVIKVGVALGGEIADYTEFDRKNYFYPDIPKGYQISQHEFPLVKGGELAGVKITRIHLEEDTARSVHGSQIKEIKGGGNSSFINFNRAGIPLMELVTEPVIDSGEKAMRFGRELQLLLRTLRVSDANMEKGEMRVEANVSISESKKLGTKVEVKNLNSFRSAGRAIDYEIKRQAEAFEKGEKIIQETRGWDENKQKTVRQRLKEEANDYRYFPDPDIPKILISEIKEFKRENILKEIPELPSEKREKFINKYGMKEEEAQIFLEDAEMEEFLENIASIYSQKGENKEKMRTAINYIVSDIAGILAENRASLSNSNLKPEAFCKLIEMNLKGDISSRGVKNILKVLFEKGGDPENIANSKNLLQKSSEEDLNLYVKKIIEENPGAVESYKNGKYESIKFLVGQGMKESGGSANPQVLEKMIKNRLK